MGFFDIFKPKKNELLDLINQLNKNSFPKGEMDFIAATDVVLHILNNSIDRVEARNIAVKSITLSRITKEFTVDRLKKHLAGYCIQHFNEYQIDIFYNYLAFLSVVNLMFNKSPSDLVRQGDTWLLPE